MNAWFGERRGPRHLDRNGKLYGKPKESFPPGWASTRALPTGLGTGREQDFEELAEIASIICGTPISIVSVLDGEWQFHKASIGMAFHQLPITNSFCRYAVAQDGIFVVPDALLDPRFAKNWLVTEGPRIRFYAGTPIHSPGGDKIGALCVIDTIPRELKDYQTHALALLARQVNAQIQRRVHRSDAAQALDPGRMNA